ncbi:hypothetical protein APR12_000426 [Nocardia amikacinitolerans]|nr:hypothetical protein [Nocardia amikacinitolerans]
MIGLMVEDSADSASTEGAPSSAPFFRGLSSSEVLRASNDLGFGDLAEFELPLYSDDDGPERRPNRLTQNALH